MDFNVQANSNTESSVLVAKQVFVARYLCKKLIDLYTPSKEVLIREMTFFSDDANCGKFGGTIDELETSFRVNYDCERRNSALYSSSGEEIEKYTIK